MSATKSFWLMIFFLGSFKAGILFLANVYS